MARIRYGKKFRTRKGKFGRYKYIRTGKRWKRVAFVKSRGRR